MTIKAEATVVTRCARHGDVAVRYYLTPLGVRADRSWQFCRCRIVWWDDWIGNEGVIQKVRFDT